MRSKFLIACSFYLYNHFITNFPLYDVRHWYIKKILRIKIGKESSVHMGCFFTGRNIKIGKNSVINRKVYLDGRYGIEIGDNVSISPECYILSLSHEVHDSKFAAVGKQVSIGNYAWIGSRAIILPGVLLGKGCVVGAGSVVTKSFLKPNFIVAGMPAKFIAARRIEEYEYKLKYFPFFDTDIT